MPDTAVNSLVRGIRSGKITGWDEVHAFYNTKSKSYSTDKLQHAFASMLEVLKLTPKRFTKKTFITILNQAIITKEWMTRGIYESRAKDHDNPFRKMVYDTEQEMEKVIGKLKDNNFILQQQEEAAEFAKKVSAIIQQLQ